MNKLLAYEKEITNIFNLIGTQENDITKSIAWVMNTCPVFTQRLIKNILDIEINGNIIIKYQTPEKNKGITDLELFDEAEKELHIIIEANDGWKLPGEKQLEKYSERDSFVNSPASHKAIIAMSACNDDYAYLNLKKQTPNGTEIKHLSWKTIYAIANDSIQGSSNAGKRMLKDLIDYIGGISNMSVKDSNWVYIVSLSRDIAGGDWSYVDIVEKLSKYYHPVGDSWPKEPPNYIAFRYDSELKSIHHIKDAEIVRQFALDDETTVNFDKDHFVYSLGPAIKPDHRVRAGAKIRSTRYWAMIDTLLTSDTILEAVKLSKER